MKNEVPIFFAVDDCYIPYMGVCIKSISDHISDKYLYNIKVLHTSVSKENQKKIKNLEKDNLRIEFVDLNKYISKISKKLYTRDYYTNTTYFRLFIPNLYPNYEKAIYIDGDTVVLDDIANLYDIEIGDNLIGGVTDGVIANYAPFQHYVEKVVGVRDYHNYFNAGLILMNLHELRKMDFQEKFIYSLDIIRFSVAQDQDYLNRLCKGRVMMIDSNWDVMPCDFKNHPDESKIKIIHYNLAEKPWHHDNIPFADYFWKYAKETEFYDTIMHAKKNYTEKQKKNDAIIFNKLIDLAEKESACVGDDRNK